MTRALTLAERGWGRVHPNPMVGAVVVRDGEIVGEGWHAEFGGPHAEVMALGEAGDAARGATLYVTLEPCNHHGKQPPCVDAVIASGVRRVVIALGDPNPEATGGAAALAALGVDVTTGVEAATAARQNGRFLRRFADAPAPFVSVKLAVTMDGFIADADGESQWVSGTAAREWVHRVRANVGAIAVGATTALRDDARLTVRGAVTPRVAPVRVVFDRSGRLDAGWKMLADGCGTPIVILGTEVAPERQRDLARAGADVIVADEFPVVMRELAARGIDSLLAEGGGRLAGAMLQADVIDRIYQVQCPVWLGEGIAAWGGVTPVPMRSAHRWRTVERLPLGDDTLLVMER
jgi:diaminohydroxyphosphoribosylaminopyrimidine deaminase/5-amino-6-(5-phosphoribosylamino)uracil reductase